MDRFFHPDHRKWISPLTNLGRSMGELKRLVRLRKDSLLVVNPTECSDRTFSRGPQSTEPGPSHLLRLKQEEVEEEESGMHGKAYMHFEAGNLGQNDVVIEAESERLQEELDRAEKNKWMKSDAACEAAVAFVGGAEYFDTSEKADKKRAEELRKKGMLVLSEGAGDSGSPVAGTSNGSNPIVEEQDDEEMDGIDDNRTSKGPEPISSTAMYENFNSICAIKQEPVDQANASETSDPLFEVRIKGLADFFPLGFKDESGGPEIDFEDDTDNFANAADRFEQYLLTRPDLLNSDSEDDARENSSDEEFYLELDSMNSGQDSATPGDAPPPPPGPAVQIPVSKIKEAKRSTLFKVKKGLSGSKNIASTSTSSTVETEGGGEAGASGDPNANSSNSNEQSLPGASETELNNAVSDFGRFTDWVFEETKKIDEEERNKIKPDLMKKMNLLGKDISHYLRTTSSTLACVKGEVFQDKPVMKSSSMPVLAPPILPPASTDLQSLAIFITHGEDPSCFPWKSINVQQQINDDFAHDEFLKQLEQQKKDLADPAMKTELVDKEDDFLIQLLVYQATDPDDVLPDEIKLFIEPRPAYELHVLGSQTVRDLMNAIHCENDFVYMKEVSHPDHFVEDPNQFAKARFPQAVMLIHETIYSSPGSIGEQFHSMVNDWAKRPPKKNIGPFKSGNWDVHLRDLDLRFGFPYVYIHLGGCEHIVVFTKSRLLHTEDNHLLRDYPKIHGMTRFKSVYCRVDNEYLARWAVLDCKDFPENPMLLCNECVLMYCYDKQKRKQCNFRLYPFTQIANII